MCRKSLRSFLASLLILAFAISLMPTITANAGQSTQKSSSQTPAKKPEPPPFDRPPMKADSDPSSTSDRSEPPAARDTRTPPSSRSSRSSDAPPSSSPRSSGPPVLQRPPASDSRTGASRQGSTDRQGDDSVFSNDPNSSGRNRDQRPTLHRPSDPQDDRSAPDYPQQNDRRNNPPPANQSADDGPDQVIKLESTLVNIPIVVSDRSGRYIPRLSKDDFVLYEDGVQQEVASFGSEEVPFNVALLLDVSPSVEGNIEGIQDAALAFVRQLRPQDRVLVASFDRNINFLTDFTSNRQELEWAIRRVRTGSGTSVYEAVYETVARRLRGIEGRKALILFSDGEDTTSHRVDYDDAINIVTESDVLVYGLRYPGAGGGGGGYGSSWPRNPFPRGPWPGIQLPLPFPWPRSRRNGPYGGGGGGNGGGRHWGGKDFMKDITEAGGGPVFDAERVGDMSGLASRIADELRHVYVVSYYPKNSLSNGGYRSIRIRVRNRDDIAVRHRRGYNAREVGAPSHTE
jgi:Ca-activated chloride channel homolog